MTQERIPSTVPPVLLAALICDVHAQDPVTGKYSLIGIFDGLVAEKLPTARPLSLYGRMTDALGFYPLRIEVMHAPTNQRVGKLVGETVAENMTDIFDFAVTLGPVVFPWPGRYDFQVWAADMFVGSAYLDVSKPGESAKQD